MCGSERSIYEDVSEFQFSSEHRVAHLDKCLAVAFSLLTT